MSPKQELNPYVEEVLTPCTTLWNQARGLSEQRLLRLTILRDLIRTMHAERSRLLALSQPERADALRRIEPRIETLKSRSLKEESLPDLVAATEPSDSKPPKIPEDLDAAVGSGKFTRYDRQWEAEIAAEAYRLGWGFWALETWIDIMKAENFHHCLNQGLWPKGIVLFVESCTDAENTPEEAAPGQSVWKGRWLVVHSNDSRPFERRIGELPGAVRPPSEMDWQAVFAPSPA